VGAITTKRLDAMPIIGRALARLGIAELIDELVPCDPRSQVTAGECVEALIVGILHGRHTLYRLDELLEPYDLELAFDWKGEAEHFHDDRLGRALDDTHAAGVMKVHTGALLRAIAAYDLEVSQIHVDTSSVSVYGDYPGSAEPAFPDDPQALPHVTRGHSKDHRADLKQIVFGLAVSADGGVPFFGRMTSGNRADVAETRWLLAQMAEVLPDPKGTTIVGDSKLFSGETLLLAAKHGLLIVTMLPRNVGLWGEGFTAFRAALSRGERLETLKVVYPAALDDDAGAGVDESAEPEKEWRGKSFDLVYAWQDESTREKHEIPVRALVVESTSLREQKTAIVHSRRDKERAKLEKIVARINKKEIGCEEDARKVAATAIERHGPDLHRLTAAVFSEERPSKRAGPGRPPADEPRAMETVWRVRLEIEHDQHDIDEAILRESCFVIITTLPREGEGACSDAEVFRRYQEQNHVETGFRMFKNPLKVAPVFIKSTARVAALGLVYVLALMTYVLIQREVRRLIAKKNDTFPGNKGFTATPTTDVIFRLFERVDTLRVDGVEGVTITNMTTAQHDALELLGHPLLIDPRVTFDDLRAPAPRQRGWRGRPRRRDA
jgi:transposase